MKKPKTIVTHFVFSMLLLSNVSAVFAQDQGREPGFLLNTATRSQVIEGVIKRFNQSYVFPEVAMSMDRFIREKMRNGEYDKITSPTVLADTLKANLREVSKDTHIDVFFRNRPLLPMSETDTEISPAERENLRRSYAQVNNGFLKVERLRGNIGFLDIDLLVDPAFAGDTSTAAMNFVANTDALIVDLRYCTGGSGRMVALLSSYFFAEPVHLTDYYQREDHVTKQSWTLPYVPGQRYLNKEIYVLTSNRTHSAAEEFAYNLQTLKRATIVGEVTRGGAHTVRSYRINEHFGVRVPVGRSINPSTKTNWEGKGIMPDVQISSDKAFKLAHLTAVRRLVEKDPNREGAVELRQLAEVLQKEIEAPKNTQESSVKIDPKIYEAYVGQYETPMGLLVVTRDGDKLMAQPAGEQKFELKPISETEFSAAAVGAQLTFVKDGRGRVTHLLINVNGQQVQGKKIK